MLNPVQLATLVAVLRTGSFANAARELEYTSSAVSQQISRLEQATRLTLFERSAKGIAPTPAAHLLAARAREALAIIQDVEDDIAAMTRGQVGSLRVGSFPTASKGILPRALRHFRQVQPNVSVSLGEGEASKLVAQVADGDIDVALVYSYDLVPKDTPASIRSLPLLVEDLHLLAPADHPLVGEPTVDWSALARVAWISTLEGTPGTECLARLCAMAGFEPQIGFRSDDYDVVREFVRTSLGFALVPALTGGAISGTAALAVDMLTVRRRVKVLHRSDRLNPALSGFISSLFWIRDDLCTQHVRVPTVED